MSVSTAGATGLRRYRNVLVYAGLAVLFVVIGVGTRPHADWYGAWSVIPPVALFVFVLVTQRVVEGFIWGAVLAVFMYEHGDLLDGFDAALFKQLTTEDNLWLIIVLLSIGAFIGVLDRSGASAAFGRWAARLARNSTAAKIVTLAIPLALSNDAYLATSTSGAAMATVNERFRTPRLFTAFLVRSAAVPGSAFNPVATGSVFVAGLLVVNHVATKTDQVAAYAALIPFMFFPMASVLVAVLAAVGGVPPIGPMKRAFADPSANVFVEDGTGERTAEPTGRVWNFFLPVLVLIAATIALGSIQTGLLIALAAAGVLYVAQRTVSPDDFVESALAGMRDMLPLAVIMAAAFVLVLGIGDLGFTTYVIQSIGTGIPPALLPVMLFVLFGITEFLVTLNWSLYILALPIVIPLAQQLGADQEMSIAALVCAGLWGTTVCLTSDVGLLNAFSTRVVVFAHWRSNLVYQLIAFVLAAVAFLVVGLVVGS
ncbi:Na+/H+ antiporter NhaC family protein [Curtobacterium sp. VKM Ac-1376]|uniref:Na+/H+ antiporter NhaC family protein n=1 Tax=Curtobacterium sp. VKM Ac-1376 TaxID=123312 RepID=UPI001E3F9B6F|nr:Na+/H+ antiporter NhaC family protein [Curtobacterium sp. VKM Ac-1376]